MPLKLEDLAEDFYKVATNATGLVNVIWGTKYSIFAEIKAGIVALNSLVLTDKQAAKSYAIQAVDDAFGEISNIAYNLSVFNIESSSSHLTQIINNVKFYTSPQNTGTGFDSSTRKGGASSPAAYIDRISVIVKRLASAVAQQPNINSPQV